MVQVYNTTLRKLFINPKEKLKIAINSKEYKMKIPSLPVVEPTPKS